MSNYTSLRPLMAEGARIGLASCLDCGAALTIDPDDRVDVKALHDAWHERFEGAEHLARQNLLRRDWGIRVEGACPACGRDTLFVGSGGWITCGWIGEPRCPNPTAVADIQEHGFDALAIDLERSEAANAELLAALKDLADKYERLVVGRPVSGPYVAARALITRHEGSGE